MSNGVQSFLSAIVIALFGLLPLGLLAMDSAPAPVTADQPIVTSTTDAGLVPHGAEAGARTAITTPAPQITGVSDEVARVLAAKGFASEEVVDGVPESVVRLLSERGAVLTIAVPEGG